MSILWENDQMSVSHLWIQEATTPRQEVELPLSSTLQPRFKKKTRYDYILKWAYGPLEALVHDKYTKTYILDPSNLSQTPILELFTKRPTIYYIETVKFRLFKDFLNPDFILALFSYFKV